MKATNILPALLLVFALPFVTLYGGGLGPVPVGADPTFNSVTSANGFNGTASSGDINLLLTNGNTVLRTANGGSALYLSLGMSMMGNLILQQNGGANISFVNGNQTISYGAIRTDTAGFHFDFNVGDGAGKVFVGPGGNVLHMLSTKPTVNGAGSPNDAWIDTTNKKLVVFTGTATAAEGSGTWSQISLTAYTP